MASGGVVSPSPIIRTQPADSSTMSTSSPTDLLRQHEEEALLPTPLSSLPGAVLVELRDHQPLVYDTMLLYDRLLATSEARTHAKEGELLRCIHVGQELMEQMGALNRRCTTLAAERDAMERRVKEAERRSANMDSPIIFRSAVAPRSSTHEGAAQPSTSFSPPPPPTATQQQPAAGSSSSSSMDHDHESLQAANEVCELLRCMLARCSSSSSADDVDAAPRGGLREVLEASMAMARRLEEHNSTCTSDVVVPVIDGTNHQQGVRAPDDDATAVMMNLEELRRRCDAALAEMRSPSSALEMERQRISRTRARLDVEMSMGMCSAEQREELAAMMDELDTARVAVEEKAIASAAAAAEANIASSSSSSSSSMNPVEVVRLVMESVEAMRRAHHESMEEVQHACVELHDEIDHQHGQRVRATASSASTQVAQREGVADLQRRLDTSLADAKGLRVVLAQEARKNEELARAQQQHEEEMALMRSELRAAGELAEERGHIAATRAADVARLEEVNAGMTTSLNELRGQTVELQAAVDGLLSMERTRMEVAEAGAMEAKDAYATEMHHLQHRVLLLEEELVLTKESVQRSRLAAQSAAELSASVVAAEVEQHNKHHREELRRAVAAREEAEARVRILEAAHSQMQKSAADSHQRAEGAREEMEALRKHLHDVFARLMEDMASHVRPIAAQHNTAVMEATAVALDRSREVLACAEAALHQVELYAHNTSSLDEHHHLAQDSATDYWLGRAHALRQLEMEANSAPPSPAKPRSTSHTPEKMMNVPPPPPLSSTSCAAEEAQRRRADFWEAALFPSPDVHESGVVFDVWRLASDMWHGLVRHQAERVRSLVMKARTRSVAITDEDGASSCTWPAEVFEVVASIMSELVALATLANTQAIQCGVHLQEQLHHAQEAQLPLQRLRHAGVDEEAMHVVHMRAAEASRIRLDECVEKLCGITRGAVEEQVEAHRRELALQSAVASARGGAACDA